MYYLYKSVTNACLFFSVSDQSPDLNGNEEIHWSTKRLSYVLCKVWGCHKYALRWGIWERLLQWNMLSTRKWPKERLNKQTNTLARKQANTLTSKQWHKETRIYKKIPPPPPTPQIKTLLMTKWLNLNDKIDMCYDIASCITSCLSYAFGQIVCIYFFTVAGCGGNFSTRTGVIQSKNYPNDYPHGTECEWLIALPVNHPVVLNFTDFHLEAATRCQYDYVDVSIQYHKKWLFFLRADSKETELLNMLFSFPAQPSETISDLA